MRASVGEAPVGTAVQGIEVGQASSRSDVQSARPGIVGPLRNLKPSKPDWHGNKITEEREATYPLRAAPGEGHDGALQSSAPGPQVPAPIVTFEGVDNRNGVLPARHERRRRAEPLHAVGEPLATPSTTRPPARCVLGPLNGNTLFSDAARTPNCAVSELRRPGRPLRPARRPLARLAVHRQPTTCASRSRRRTTRPARGARTSTCPTRRSSRTTRSSASGRARTRT